MLAAIQFDDQACFRAIEVSNEYTDWLLAPKAKAVELSLSKVKPEALLGFGWVLSQMSSNLEYHNS